MKILSQLWQIFKGEEEPNWIMHQAKWDPKNKLYIVGEMAPSTLVEDVKPEVVLDRTVDSGPIPPDYHQCFYYYEYPNIPGDATGGYHYRRCRNLAGPGLKPTFCLMHEKQEKKSHIVAEQEKREEAVTLPLKYSWCRYGPCTIKLFDGQDYCSAHSAYAKDAALERDIEDCGCYGYCEQHFNGGKPRSQEDIDWDNIKEDVDWIYCSKIGWGQIAYRRNRKSIPVQAQETVHFKLELRGSRDEIDLFHAMLALCDSDYPLDPFRKNTAIPKQCDNCKGFIWPNAIVTAVDIKKAAKQAGITVKVRHYFPESTCKKKDRAANA